MFASRYGSDATAWLFREGRIRVVEADTGVGRQQIRVSRVGEKFQFLTLALDPLERQEIDV